MSEGPFSENGNPNFFSSAGEECRILGESFTAGLLFLTQGHGGWHILTKLSRYRVIYQQKVIYILHSPRTILREPERGVTPFSSEKLSYWLLFFLILHSPRTHSPTSEKV
jgi:hypothetical protein